LLHTLKNPSIHNFFVWKWIAISSQIVILGKRLFNLEVCTNVSLSVDRRVHGQGLYGYKLFQTDYYNQS
jgi:hypothetical protein